MKVKKKPGPKPKVYSEEKIKIIGNLAGIGATVEMTANVLGIPHGTFKADMARNDLIRSSIKKGRDQKLSQLMETAFHIAIEQKNPAMVMFLLKVRAGWRETESVTVDEAPIDFEKLKAAV